MPIYRNPLNWIVNDYPGGEFLDNGRCSLVSCLIGNPLHQIASLASHTFIDFRLLEYQPKISYFLTEECKCRLLINNSTSPLRHRIPTFAQNGGISYWHGLMKEYTVAEANLILDLN
jgi:hypothetical protein